MKGQKSERGAAAVEFALVVPLLIAMIFGMVLMGAAYNTQITLTQIARAGVRSMVVNNNPITARNDAMVNVASLPGFSGSNIIFSPTSCTPGATMTATASFPVDVPFMPPGGKFLGKTPMTLIGKASMACGG